MNLRTTFSLVMLSGAAAMIFGCGKSTTGADRNHTRIELPSHTQDIRHDDISIPCEETWGCIDHEGYYQVNLWMDTTWADYYLQDSHCWTERSNC